ncbi:MAG: metallophosphoesterase [Candidatus Leucobacter sulfamidivorax]|nr:metallophosphoesterase [Candidatus Leucobacter sulfamidivorax]
MSRSARILGATALGVVGWATLVEPRLFALRRHTLPVLPAGATPLRVLQLSDLHLAPWQHRKIAWVRRLVELRPDLVVLTGDLMGHRFARGPLLHALRPFSEAGIATAFVHGSNDYYGPIPKNPLKYLLEPSRRSTRKPDLDNAELTRGLTELGFVDLNNAARRIELRGTELELFGLGDPHIRYDRPEAMREAIAGLAGTSETEDSPTRIGVVHAPYQAALNALLDSGAELILAGHTHGGQVRVPGIGALTANCDLPPRLARGLDVWYDAEHAAFLNVSAGLGASIYSPIRFACRPEASLITLEAVTG